MTVMTVNEVCEESRMSSSFVRREIIIGNLKAARFGKGERGELRIKRSDYDAWFDAHLVVPVRPGAW